MEENSARTDQVKATIYTDKFKIVGYVHLLLRDSYRGRLSDHLNSGQINHFIPVTDAEVFDVANDKLLHESTCIILNKRLIEAIIEEGKES